MKKTIFLALLILIFVAIYFLTPLKSFLSFENLENLKLWIESQGSLAPLIFVLLYIAVTILCLPGSVFTIVAGLIFGVWLGTALVFIGANMGVLCTFFITRYVGRETAEKILRGKLVNLDQRIKDHGFDVVLWLRLIPAFPYNVLNYTFGLTQVKTKDYILGNILGMLPGTFVYVSLGNAASHFSLTDPQVWAKIEVWGPFLLIILLSLLPKIFKRGIRHK